jgi:uncharacterized protein (TIGR03435 family)
MHFMIRAIAGVSLIVFTSSGALGQPTAAAQAFELASVKANKSGDTGSRFHVRNGTFTATNNSLQDCIRWAYGVRDYQISGPDWLKSERYDIVAKASSPVPGGQIMLMLQTLLADRFKLTLHREQKLLPVYALVAGKNGLKLHKAETGGSHTNWGRSRLTAQQTSMLQFAETLSRKMDRPVLDMTGLEGVFDFILEYTPDDDRGVAGDSVPGPSIFTAMQEQLGLKLEARKAPAEILVIDHAEKVPAEN